MYLMLGAMVSRPIQLVLFSQPCQLLLWCHLRVLLKNRVLKAKVLLTFLPISLLLREGTSIMVRLVTLRKRILSGRRIPTHNSILELAGREEDNNKGYP